MINSFPNEFIHFISISIKLNFLFQTFIIIIIYFLIHFDIIIYSFNIFYIYYILYLLYFLIRFLLKKFIIF